MVRPSTIFCRPAGPTIFRGSVLPALPMVRSRPGRPEIWSAWKWVMQMTSMALNPQPSIFMVTCVPSPQSISASLPLSLASIAVRKRLGIGIMPPVPSKQISNISFLLIYQVSFINILSQYVSFIIPQKWVKYNDFCNRILPWFLCIFPPKTPFFFVRKKIRIFCLFFLQNCSISARISLLCHIGKFEGGATDG